MSNLSAAAAALPGVPEDLVQRSAEARAEASGSSAEDILASWGGAAPVAAVSAAPVVEAAEAVAAESTPQVAAVAVAEPETVAEAPIEAVLEEELDPVEPAGTFSRLTKGRRLGAGFGLAAGLTLAFLLLLNLTKTMVIADSVLVGSIAPRKVVFGTAILMGLAGRFIASVATRIPAAINRSYELEGSAKQIKLTGTVVGLGLGLILGTLIKKLGSPDLLDPAIQIIPVMKGFVGLLVGGGVIGAVIGTLSQVVALPDPPDTGDDH